MRDPAERRRPRPSGPSAQAAGAVDQRCTVPWPTHLSDERQGADLATALGTGGDAVVALLHHLTNPGPPPTPAQVATLAVATPAGPAELPVDIVPLAEGVVRAAMVDRSWLAEVDRQRSAPRRRLLDTGRGPALETALHVAMLVATEVLDPADDADVDAHVASGAQLWLLGGAVAWALTGTASNPYHPWSGLIAAGLWPVGPAGGRLVVSTVAGAS